MKRAIIAGAAAALIAAAGIGFVVNAQRQPGRQHAMAASVAAAAGPAPIYLPGSGR